LDDVRKEVLKAEKQAYPPGRLWISTILLKEEIEKVPENFPILSSLTSKHQNQIITEILVMEKYRPTGSKCKNSTSGRAFWRPEGRVVA
jgi:hypothetical protein